MSRVCLQCPVSFGDFFWFILEAPRVCPGLQIHNEPMFKRFVAGNVRDICGSSLHLAKTWSEQAKPALQRKLSNALSVMNNFSLLTGLQNQLGEFLHILTLFLISISILIF